MTKRFGLLSAAAVLVACVATAEDMPHGSGAGGPAHGMPGTASPGSMNRHEMTGTISSIDRTSGMVKLNSEGRQLDLHFPPGMVQQLKQGDLVTVQLAIRPADRGTAPRGAGDAPMQQPGGAGTPQSRPGMPGSGTH